ncbi:WD40-repeat-containing domain protein [Armillaria nabsnona]|nr:WD40-repeat-containing domain protein [Armillaria nabsnona]
MCSRTIARTGESGQVNRLAISPDEGKWLVAGSEDGTTIKIWDLRSPHLHRTYDNSELISCDQAGSIKQWDLSENVCSCELLPIISDGSCLVAGNNKGQCYVWKLNEEASSLPHFQAVTTFHAPQRISYAQEKILTGHQRWVWDCVFSADSAYLITASSDHSATYAVRQPPPIESVLAGS